MVRSQYMIDNNETGVNIEYWKLRLIGQYCEIVPNRVTHKVRFENMLDLILNILKMVDSC